MSAVAQPRSGVTVRRRVVDWVPAIVVFFAAIAVWQISIDVFNIQKFLLPKPWAIVSSFWTQRSLLWSAGWLTLKEALGGFVIGSSLGILSAVVLARFRRLGEALMPLAIAANAIPIIAFSPIFNAWFDPLSPAPRIATAAVLCFFPVMVNTLRGLTSVRPSQIELMRSYAAGEFEIFRRVRVPTALPFVFAALKVATVLAMIGAIVSDYFGTFGSLGITIKNSVSLFDFETAWAAILMASILGVLLYLAVALAERYRPPVGSNPSGKGHCMKGKTLLALLALVIAAAAAHRGVQHVARRRNTEAHQGDAAAQVGHAGAVRRLLRGRREGLLQEGSASTSRSRSAARTSRPSRSCSRARRSSASTGCRTSSPRERRAARSSRSPRSSRARE